MKKMIFIFGVCFLTGTCSCFSQDSKNVVVDKAISQTANLTNKAKPLSPEALTRKHRIMTKIGGFLDVPGSGPAVVIFDTRKVEDGLKAQISQVFKNVYRQPLSVEAGTLPTDKTALEFSLSKRKTDKALAVISLVQEGPDKPVLSIYPEDRVAIVNLSRLTHYDKKRTEARIIKETWRALGFVLGVGYAQNDADVMQPIGSTFELDAIKWQVIQPMNYMRIGKVLNKYGVKRGHRTTYRRACEEGWAPMPVDEYQRGVWQEVNSKKTKNTGK